MSGDLESRQAPRSPWIPILSGAALLIVFAAIAFYLWKTLTAASDNIIAVVVTGLVSIVTIFFGRYLEQRRDIAQRANVERVRIYQEISKTFQSFFSKQALTSSRKVPESDLVEALQRIQSELFFWGSDSVIFAWEALHLHLRQSNSEDPKKQMADVATSLGLLGRLTIAMRKDVGYPHTKVTEETYARLTLANGESEKALIQQMKQNLKRRN